VGERPYSHISWASPFSALGPVSVQNSLWRNVYLRHKRMVGLFGQRIIPGRHNTESRRHTFMHRMGFEQSSHCKKDCSYTYEGKYYDRPSLSWREVRGREKTSYGPQRTKLTIFAMKGTNCNLRHVFGVRHRVKYSRIKWYFILSK
jgi:hypothetical protein